MKSVEAVMAALAFPENSHIIEFYYHVLQIIDMLF